jgi:hypothetical protein
VFPMLVLLTLSPRPMAFVLAFRFGVASLLSPPFFKLDIPFGSTFASEWMHRSGPFVLRFDFNRGVWAPLGL